MESWIELNVVTIPTIQSLQSDGVFKKENNTSSSRILGDQTGEKMVTSRLPPLMEVGVSVESTPVELGHLLIDHLYQFYLIEQIYINFVIFYHI